MKNLGFLFILALASSSAMADKNVVTFSNMTVAVAETAAPITWAAHYTDDYASRKEVKVLERNVINANSAVKVGLEQQIAELLAGSIELKDGESK